MKKWMQCVFLFCAVLVGNLSAEQYVAGSKVVPFEANDQHGKAFKLDNGTRYLLVSADMKTGKKANKILNDKGAGFLEKKKAVYVANIYGMPGIGRLFAFKKMKKYAHRIVYADTEKFMQPYPVEKSKVTVIKLNSSGVIVKISHWDPVTEDISEFLK